MRDEDGQRERGEKPDDEYDHPNGADPRSAMSLRLTCAAAEKGFFFHGASLAPA
jgi:hypothetical protein